MAKRGKQEGPFHPDFRAELERDERTAWAAQGLGVVAHAAGEARVRTDYWLRPLEGGAYPGADPVFVGQVACLAAALRLALRRTGEEAPAASSMPVFADPAMEADLELSKYERWLAGRSADDVRSAIANLWELTHAPVWVETMERLRLSPALVLHDPGLGRAWWGLVTIHAALHGAPVPDFFGVVRPPQPRRPYVAAWPRAERRNVLEHLRPRLARAEDFRACLDLASRLPQACAHRGAPEADGGW